MLPSLEDIGSFAAERVRGTLAQRYEAGVFSRDIWKAMGGLGLLGMTVPEQYGGSGGSPLRLAESLREFARAGCDLGLTLCWITHLALCAKSIEDFGTEEQKEQYLPRLAAGEIVGAAAVSEPQSGAHPGGITTTATETGSGFRLDGRKIYITDGPEADLLVVMAVTGESEGRKELTTFLVDSGSPGFEVLRMDLNFVKTSPHGEIAFHGVELESDAVLGGRGEGHAKYSRAAFARERSLVVAAFPGFFESAAAEASELMTRAEEGLGLEGAQAYSWIHHLSALEGYRRLSTGVVETAFEDPVGLRASKSMDVLIYLGISYAKWAGWMEELVASQGIAPSFPLDIMLNDMKLVMVGEKLLVKEARKRFMR